MASWWLRVESDRPARLFAPSHCPPPTMEGFDKLYDPPLALRRFHCPAARPCVAPLEHTSFGCCGSDEEVVHLFRFPNEPGLGTVTIACGGVHLGHIEASHIVALAMFSLRSTTLKAAADVLDAIATRHWSASSVIPHQLDAMCSPEIPVQQAPARGNLKFLEWNSVSSSTQLIEKEVAVITKAHLSTPEALGFERVKPSLMHFVLDSVAVPVHPLLCGIFVEHSSKVWNSAPSALVIAADDTDAEGWLLSPVAYTDSAPSRNDVVADASHQRHESRWRLRCPDILITDLARCVRIQRGLLFVSAKLLSQSSVIGSPWADPHHCVTALCSGGDSGSGLLAFAVFSLGGLVFGSRSFLSQTAHWEKLMIATVAMDALIPKKHREDISVDPSALECVRVVELTVKLSRLLDASSGVAQAVMVSIGSAVTLVFIFGADGQRRRDTSGQDVLRATAFAKTARTVLQLGEATSDTKRSSKRSAAGAPDVAPERHTPVFSGLASSSVSVSDCVNACTAEPTDAMTAKWFDQLQSSDDEDNGDSASCTPSCVSSRAVGSKRRTPQDFARIRSSQRQLERVLQNETHVSLLQFAARWRRVDHAHLLSLRKLGIEAMSAVVQCSGADAVDDTTRAHPERLLALPPFHTFECSWWRHWITSALPPQGYRHSRRASLATERIRDTASSIWLGEAAACLRSASSNNRASGAVAGDGNELPDAHMLDFISTETDRSLLLEAKPDTDAGSDPITLFHHVEARVVPDEVRSVLVSSAIVNGHEWLDDDNVEALVTARGFDVASRQSPFAARASVTAVDVDDAVHSWRTLKRVHRHMSLTAIAAAFLQRRL